MHLRYLTRFSLLSFSFAVTTIGLLAWAELDFDLANVWREFAALNPHPIFILGLGIALIPPALWEIFILEAELSPSIKSPTDSD